MSGIAVENDVSAFYAHGGSKGQTFLFCKETDFGHSGQLLELYKSKKHSACRRFCSWPSDQGLCPWTPLEALPQTSVIGWRSALTICLQNSGRGSASDFKPDRTPLLTDFTRFQIHVLVLKFWGRFCDCSEPAKKKKM